MRTPGFPDRRDLGFPLILTVGLIALFGAGGAFLQEDPR